MVKKKEHLFQLIKSLTKEEKRHFKLYVNKYNSARENNYIRLFNAIDRQDIYDEDSIKQQFKNDTFVKQLTVTKHYLQKQIIKSLQSLHYENSDDLKVLVLHHQIAVLFKKGHYEICRELVKKGLELSARNELFLEWIGFLKLEIDLINKMDIADYKRSLSDYLENTSRLLSWYEINTQGNHLINQLQIFFLDTQTFGTKTHHYQNLISKIEKLISSTQIETLPLKARYNLYFPLAQSYLIISDYYNAFEIFSQMYEEMRDEYKRRDLHEQYINVMVGLLYSAGASNRYKYVSIANNELKNVPEINRHISYRKAESLAFYPLINCAIIGDFYNGLTAIEITESFMEEYKEKTTAVQLIYAHYFSAYIYLGNNNTGQALKYLRKLDSFFSRDILPNLRLSAKIMEILIFLEQRKNDLAESRLRSLQRNLQKEINIKPFLKKFKKYYQKIISFENDPENVTALYGQLLNELLEMSKAEQISMFIHFDMISWLQSKIENCSFGEKLQVNAHRLFVGETKKQLAS